MLLKKGILSSSKVAKSNRFYTYYIKQRHLEFFIGCKDEKNGSKRTHITLI